MRKPVVVVVAVPRGNVGGTAPHVVALRRIIRSGSSTLDPAPGSSRRAKACEYIRRLQLQLHKQPQLIVTLTDVAYLLDLEVTYCSRVFREITGKSFTDWIRTIRILRAKDLLAD